MKPRTVALCAALLAATAMTAASPVAAAADNRVVLLDGPISDQFIGAMTSGFTKEAKADGLDVYVEQSDFNPALQARQLDDAIAKKVNLIAMMIMSQKALIPALTRAKQAHIPVVLINTPIPQHNLFTAFVGENSQVMGSMAADAMAEGLKGRTPAKVAIVAGDMVEGIAPARVAGFKAELANKHPGIKVVAVEATHWTPPEAERAAGQLLARFSGQGGLQGIYGMNDALANGVVQAAESAGAKLGTAKDELVVVGGNCLPPGIRDIEQGKMFATLAWSPVDMGHNAADTAKKILDGQTVQKMETATPAILTKANLDKYKSECMF